MGFVISLDGGRDLYAGKTYVHQGQYYPSMASPETPVKVYSTRRRAEAAAWRLSRKIGDNVEVVEYVE
jgi:hypothetical protein